LATVPKQWHCGHDDVITSVNDRDSVASIWNVSENWAWAPCRRRCRCHTRCRAVSTAGIQIAPVESAPDDHLVAGPDSRVEGSGSRREEALVGVQLPVRGL